MKNIFSDLLSLSEASEIWNVDDSVIRRAILSNKLVQNEDAKKFGKQWVVTKQGMTRVFGYVPFKGLGRYNKDKFQAAFTMVSMLAVEYSKQHNIPIKETYTIFYAHGIPQLIVDCYEDYEHYAAEDLLEEIKRKIKEGFKYVKNK